MLKRNQAGRLGVWALATMGLGCPLLVACVPRVVDGVDEAGGSGGSAGEQMDTEARNAGTDSGGSAKGNAGAGSSAPITYSPKSCKAAGGMPVASPGAPQTPDRDCKSGVALGIIDSASSGWDEGGLCCAVGKDPVTLGESCGGGPLFIGCAQTEYCAYEAGEGFCGVTDASGVCKLRPEGCIELYAPVCGCDQKTYGNSCLANAAGTGIFSAGVCGN